MNNAQSMPEAIPPSDPAQELKRLSAFVRNNQDRADAQSIADEGNAEVEQAYETQIAHMEQDEEQLRAFEDAQRASTKEEEQRQQQEDVERAESEIDNNA